MLLGMADALFFLIGAILGSFGNVLIFRLPEGKSIGGRSQCPKCHRILTPSELVPVASFLVQRGRCRGCRAKISWQYPLVEILSGLLFVVAFRAEPSLIVAIVLALTLWLFLLIAVMDAQTGLIADALSIPLLVVAAGYAIAADRFSMIAILLGGGFFACQWLLSRGRWVGSGDILLGAGIGLLLGSWQLTLVSLMLAYIAGALIASCLLLLKRKMRADSIPFGPFLVTSAIGTFLWGETLLMFLL